MQLWEYRRRHEPTASAAAFLKCVHHSRCVGHSRFLIARAPTHSHRAHDMYTREKLLLVLSCKASQPEADIWRRLSTAECRVV